MSDYLAQGRAMEIEASERKRGGRKNTAKYIRDYIGQTVIIAFNSNSYYYTGIANLVSKPEFADQQLVHSISSVIDHFEDIMDCIFEAVEKQEILIGKESPFGDSTTAIIQRISHKNEQVVMVVLGPARMDYDQTIGLLDFINKQL